MCFEYDDYPEMYDERTVKVRKPHRCHACRKIILAGQSAKLATGKFDGAFFRSYQCEACQRMILSIAAEEIQHGCNWSEAWCSPDDLQSYLSERHEPVVVLEGTLEECRKRVDELWSERVAEMRKTANV